MLLLAAVLVTNIGNGMHTLVVSKLLYDATGSSAAFGVVLVGEYAINFLLQLVAGSAVDRGNPRLVSVWADLLRGAFICIAAVMLGASGSGKYWVFATVIVINAAKPFYRSATFALAPIVVQADQLLTFNGLSGSLLQAGQLLGVALVGPVLANFAVATAFALNGISFLTSGVLILCARVPAVARPPRSTGSFLHNTVHDWGEIIRLLRRDLALAAHVVLCAGDFLLVSFVNLTLVPYVNGRLGGTAYWLSVLDGGFAVGALTAGGLSAA
ncbi:MAG TPA: MFS transporter, partial [Kofleriaceae bacterium]